MERTPLDDLGLGALALLRTAGWVYGLLVVAAAATAPLDIAPSLAAGLILPLTPLVLTAVAGHLLAARGRRLRAVPFALAATAAAAVILALRSAGGDGLTDAALAALAIAATGLALALLGPETGRCGTTRRWPRETEGHPSPTQPAPPTPASGAQTHAAPWPSSGPTGSASAQSSASSPSPPASTSSRRSSSGPSSTPPSRSGTTPS